MDHVDKLAHFKALTKTTPDAPLKGAGSKYTSMNGHMFAFLSPEGVLAFRLPEAEREAWLEAHPEAVVVQYDAVMSDYIGVDDETLGDGAALQALWGQVMDHARTLKAKKFTKPKKAKPPGKYKAKKTKKPASD